MEICGIDAVPTKFIRQLFGSTARARIYDAGLTDMFNRPLYYAHWSFCCFIFHANINVRAVETCLDNQWVFQSKIINDFSRGFDCGGCGKGRNRRPLGQRGDESADAQVVGPKILSPLQYAVGFIDYQQINRSI